MSDLNRELLESAKLQLRIDEGTDQVNDLHTQLAAILVKTDLSLQKIMTPDEIVQRLSITNTLIRVVIKAHNNMAIMLQGAIDGYEKELQDVENV